MHYNIALGAEKYFFFLLIFFIYCKDGDGVGVLEPIRDMEEIRFIISA